MPNHVTNYLTVSGDPNSIKQLKELVKGEDQQFFDFNKIIPMPKELEGTTSPTRIVSQAEYDEKLRLKNEGKLHEFETLPITQAMFDDYRQRFGFTDWYSWRTNHWDTKWNCYSINADNWDSENTIVFQTAWSTPLAIFEELSRKFPDLSISVRYYDEDFGSNVGEFTLCGGEMEDQNIPDNLEDGLRLAVDISGDDYQYTEGLCEYEEEENNGEYVNCLIKLAHENGVLLENYPIFVLKKLKALAIRSEQYERVIEINNLINKKRGK